MSARTIDLNADMGESFGRWELGDDRALLDVVISANIACGFHAGDATTILDTVTMAADGGVRIGAQVGYRDLAGFGRRHIDMAPKDLTADVLYQLAALDGLCRTVGTAVAYVKPHGALYHAAHDREADARAILDAVTRWPGDIAVMAMEGSVLLAAAVAAGVPTIREGFVDRTYDGDRLRPRSQDGAVITDREQVVAQAKELATRDDVDSLCLHGDTPGAVDLAQLVRDRLRGAGWTLSA